MNALYVAIGLALDVVRPITRRLSGGAELAPLPNATEHWPTWPDTQED